MQRIAPAKRADGGPDKFFLKGGRKSAYIMCWGSVARDPAGPAVVLVAEGYATAASLHEATGRSVFVAFDAGNMAHVAKALHKQYPAALLVICGDDDAQNLTRTGNNPGRDNATAAARSVRGLAVFPAPLTDGGSDFNDLYKVAGLEAVRCIVEAAIDAHQASPTSAHAAQSETSGEKPAKTSGASLAGPMVRVVIAPMSPSLLTLPACGSRVLTKTANASPPSGFAAP